MLNSTYVFRLSLWRHRAHLERNRGEGGIRKERGGRRVIADGPELRLQESSIFYLRQAFRHHFPLRAVSIKVSAGNRISPGGTHEDAVIKKLLTECGQVRGTDREARGL